MDEGSFSKFSNPEALVMDPLSGTLSTENSFLSLNNHIRFIRCDIDSDCFHADLPGSSRVFARQIIDDDSCITVDYNVKHASLVYVAAM